MSKFRKYWYVRTASLIINIYYITIYSKIIIILDLSVSFRKYGIGTLKYF